MAIDEIARSTVHGGWGFRFGQQTNGGFEKKLSGGSVGGD